MGNLPPSGVRPELYWNLTATLAYAVVLAVLIGLLKILLRVAKSRMLPRPKYVAVDARFTKYDAGQNWYDLGVPRCCGAFTPSTRVVSRRGGRGWSLFRF